VLASELSFLISETNEEASDIKKKVGRPKVGSIPVLVRPPPALAADLDRYRDGWIDSRPEAIRTILDDHFTPMRKRWAREDRRRKKEPKGLHSLRDIDVPPSSGPVHRQRLGLLQDLLHGRVLQVGRVGAARHPPAEKIGALSLFLASEAAASITGVALPVDGGWTARGRGAAKLW
jgi:hypothetical protein